MNGIEEDDELENVLLEEAELTPEKLRSNDADASLLGVLYTEVAGTGG